MELRGLFITPKVVKSILYLNHGIQWKMKFRVKSLVWAQWKGNFLWHVTFLLMVKSPKSVLDEAYFSRFFRLFTMSKKIIFCKKYFFTKYSLFTHGKKPKVWKVLLDQAYFSHLFFGFLPWVKSEHVVKSTFYKILTFYSW